MLRLGRVLRRFRFWGKAEGSKVDVRWTPHPVIVIIRDT